MALCALLAVDTPPSRPSLFPVQRVWTLALNHSLSAPPTFRGERGYFLIDGQLAAYDVALGQPLWSVAAQALSRPASGDGLVFIATPASLLALRESDGAVAWRLPFTEGLASPLVWDNGWLIAASTSGTLLALRALDGQLIWRRDIGSAVSASPASAAGRVYLPVASGRVIALQIETGSPIWERRLGGTPNDLLARDDRLYVGSTDNFLYCMKTGDGEIDWKWRTGADVVGTPAADEQLVYFVSLDNVLRGLDRKTGNQRWKRALPLRPSAGPLKAADALIVSGVAPTLHAYSARDGSPAGDVTTEGELAAPPYFLDSPVPTLVVVTRDIAKGATMTAFSHATEPAVAPAAPPANPTQTPVPKP